MQLEGADIVLGVEMQSTGEVACFGKVFMMHVESLRRPGFNLPVRGRVLITAGGPSNKETSSTCKKDWKYGYSIMPQNTPQILWKVSAFIQLKGIQNKRTSQKTQHFRIAI
jgi:hypothetical protein